MHVGFFGAAALLAAVSACEEARPGAPEHPPARAVPRWTPQVPDCPAAERDRLRAQREAAILRGIGWMARFLAEDDRIRSLGSDAVVVFLELGLNSASPAIRARAMGLARRAAQRLLPYYLGRGGLRDRDDFFDALSLAVDAPLLGLPPDRLLSALRRRFRAFRSADRLFDVRLGRLPQASEEAVYSVLIDAYTLERAAAAFPGAFPASFSLEDALRFLWTRPLAQPAEAPARSESHAYLSTHVAYVLTEYSRHALSAADLGPFHAYLRSTFGAYLRAGDVELIAETADVFRQLGATDEDDRMVCAATRLLLSRQNPDGSWGDWRGEEDPYDAIHYTWAAVYGLRERFPLPDSAYARRARAILARLRNPANAGGGAGY